ncbi:hypothetical protein TWF694_004583 [Orbilia ellipsospora]|uniref:Nephrocystin 3-like N-terminal domain-containing protein n=1 Tax=Orbilia ellipsospora TaxID=2528407 RepID=A0AAV9WVP1_9PEZI
MDVSSGPLPMETPSSQCWEKAQELFIAEVKASRRFSAVEVNAFLHRNYQIDRAINSCTEMKTKVDKEYSGGRGRFATKLLTVLRTVKDVGDAFLEFAPESVSIAWSAVSILIKVGTDDLDKCEMIAGCCENIVTIILNCRLYENRFNSSKLSETPLQDIEQKIMDAIPNLLYLILDFSWHTNYHLDKNRLLRSFKECFSNTLKNKIENLISEYQKLRTIAQDVFQETVMLQLSSIQNLDKRFDQLQADLFPKIQDLTLKLDQIEETISARFEVEDARADFSQRCQRFKPSQIHMQNFLLIFEPIRNEYKDMSSWLYADQSYRDWEDLANDTVKLLCLKGPRGFGKSVKMTHIIKRQMDMHAEHGAVTLFFYFRKGEEMTQTTTKAFESLLCQLLEHKFFSNDIEILGKCVQILTESESQVNTPELLTTLITRFATLLDRPIYIAIDGIDECFDRLEGNLGQSLKQLCRSPTSTIKVICSSRDSIDIESLLSENYLEVASTSDYKNRAGSSTPLPTDIRIIKIDDKANSDDLKLFLTNKVEALVLRRAGGKKGRRFLPELEKIVNIIYNKAVGNFAYATMVVANLQQPTKLTLERKLLELPSEIEGMYQRSLEALKPDERELVVYALKWVVWGLDTVSVLEVVEHYKGMYSVPQVAFSNNTYDPYSDPEILDTRYHLYNASRDFFQFNNIADTISVHLSVKEWIQSEAEKFAKQAQEKNEMKLTKGDDGRWALTVIVPSSTVQHTHTLDGLMDKREAHLALATDTLYALNNKGFQDRYRPWNPPKSIPYNKLWDKPWHKDKDIPVSENESGECPQLDQSVKSLEEVKSSVPGSNLTFSRRRYEIKHWGEHLDLLQKEWRPEERKGPQWDEFWEQLKILMEPRNWKRWGNFISFPTWHLEDWSRPHRWLYESFDTPIAAVARKGLVFILDYLVEHNIATLEDLNGEVDGVFSSPIHDALQHPNIIQAFHKYGADINRECDGDGTPLNRALNCYPMRRNRNEGKAYLDAAKVLIRAGASLEASYPWRNCRPLLAATKTRDLELFFLIFSETEKANRKMTDNRGDTAMHYLFSGDMDFGLLNEVRTADEIDEYIRAGREIFNSLLRTGADIQAQNSNGETPLHYAAEQGDLDGIKWLLDHGADTETPDKDGNTCLHTITKSSSARIDPVEVARALLNAGADLIRENSRGETALSMAIENHDLSLVRFLIQNYTELYPSNNDHFLQEDASSQNLLHKCAARKDQGVEIAKLIVEGLSDENILHAIEAVEGKLGYTPLHVASESLHPEMVKYLLDLKADAMSKTFSGQTALDVAIGILPFELAPRARFQEKKDTEEIEKRSVDCLSSLLAVVPISEFNFQPLSDAAIRSHSKILFEFSLQGGSKVSDLEITDGDGWNIYHTALYSGATDILQDCLANWSYKTVYDSLPQSKRPTRLSATNRGSWCEMSEDGLETWFRG